MDDTWTTEQVATYFQVGPQTVRAWARDGKLPSFTLPGGRGRRFRLTDVKAFMDAQLKQPA